MVGSVISTAEEKRFALLHKQRLVFRKIAKTVRPVLTGIMHMLASRKWPGVRRLCPGATGKLGIRNRDRLGVPRFFPLIGLPKIRSLGR